MFESIPTTAIDPIFRVMAAFQADPRPERIDLGIGILRNPQGATPVMQAVQQAEQLWLQQQRSKAYLGPAGREAFNQHIRQLLLPEIADSPQLACLQTPGGSGALRIAGDLLNLLSPGARLWLSSPGWVTHHAIFPAAGLRLAEYRYLDPHHGGVDFHGLMEDMAQVQAGDIVLLQVAGHNPSGAELSLPQWQQLAERLAASGALPLLDLAYHGLRGSLREDRLPLAAIRHCHDQWLCCYSCSKTFGLYAERTGALLLHTHSAALTARVRQEAINRICASYYMPPDHGAATVVTLLNSAELTALWQQELDNSRHRLMAQRKALASCDALSHSPLAQQLRTQAGLFSYLNLSDQQLDQLAQTYAIYAGVGGRLNLSGINPGNCQRIGEALAAVLRL